MAADPLHRHEPEADINSAVALLRRLGAPFALLHCNCFLLHLSHPLQGREPELTITLRHRADNALCGLLLALHDRGEPSAWHAHSLLCDADARRAFGAYALFDAAIEHVGAEH
ncbi:hypothetical protein [Halochromatium roseum]|uniref:hypothetical protein n=1 Tax=Halochromatium roseum TaxID=391920 RepID=UPI0019131F9F|nr:hypothetical protein [Halochromatium roseum]